MAFFYTLSFIAVFGSINNNMQVFQVIAGMGQIDPMLKWWGLGMTAGTVGMIVLVICLLCFKLPTKKDE